MRNKVIGLTGNTGSGKTSVSKILQDNGALIIDADSIAHEIILPKKPAYLELLDYFGDILAPDGTIDRKKLGAIAFSDETNRKKLMEITHKYIIWEMLEILDAGTKSDIFYPCIVMDAPLLIEAGLHHHSDEVWLVYAEENIRLQRIMQRDNIPKSQALLRMNTQLPFDELKKYADIVIENTGNIIELEQKIKDLLRRT